MSMDGLVTWYAGTKVSKGHVMTGKAISQLSQF